MQITIYTFRLMAERAIRLKSRLWLICLVLASLFILTPKTQIPAQLISFTVLLPGLLFLPEWNCSPERKGILAITARSEGISKVKTAEWLLPTLAGAALSSITVFAVSAPPPWQFWVVAPIIAASFSLILVMTEQNMKHAGRTVLSLLWLTQITQPQQTGKITDFLLFTGYPAAVLTGDPGAGSHHPDSFVLASLIVIFITAGVYALFSRRNYR